MSNGIGNGEEYIKSQFLHCLMETEIPAFFLGDSPCCLFSLWPKTLCLPVESQHISHIEISSK